MSLAGRRALITGGGSGAGAALARAFVHAGAEVVVAGRRPEPLQELALAHGAIRPVTADVTDPASVEAMFASAGPVDIVIANAGAAESAPFSRTDPELWGRMMAVNLTGVYLTFRAGLAQMPGWGRLIAVASTAGLRGYPYVTAYAAAKHGVVGLVRALALELARREVTVNAICPGFLDTPMTERSIANIMEKTGKTHAQALAALTAHNPQDRLIRPDEVAAAALWLCGAGSDGVTGQAISVSGGEA